MSSGSGPYRDPETGILYEEPSFPEPCSACKAPWMETIQDDDTGLRTTTISRPAQVMYHERGCAFVRAYRKINP